MNFPIATWIQNIHEFIGLRPWLNGLIQFSILILVVITMYRFLMSSKAAAIRKAIPWLASLHAQRQIRSLVDAGEYAQAGDQLLALGQPKQAVLIFEQGNLFGRAADVYLRMRKFEKAALRYEQAGDFLKAAHIYLDQKKYDRAESNLANADRLDELGDLYAARGEHQRAGEAYLRASQFGQAAESFLAIEAFDQAAQAYLKAEKPLEAAQAFDKAGLYEKAASLYEQAHQWMDAARSIERTKDYLRAAHLYEQGGNLGKASELLRKGGDSSSAARLEGEKLYQAGQLHDSVKKFQEAGEYLRAAEIYRELTEPEKAAAMYERAKEYSLAASAYLEAKRYEDAARTYERAGATKEAIECYEFARLPAKQAALQEKVGDYIGLARNFHRRGLLDEALDALSKIKEDDPHHSSSLSLKGKIYLDKGEALQAKPFFEKSLEKAGKLNVDDVDTVYNLALASDQSQTDSKALELLEKMLASGMVEKEAQDKAQNVRKLLVDRAFTKMSNAARIVGSKLFATNDASLTHMTASSQKRYVIVKEIGHGGMGVVYQARDTNLDRIVALKILGGSFKRNEQAVRTFLREAKAAAALNHPNIVTVHDSGIQDGDYYIAMEFIEGKTIKEIIRARKKLSYSSVVEVMRQLFDGLAFAHLKSVVHRDLTTNNLMWTKQKMVKIMDFGLAKIVKELLTEQSIIGGTPSFMSPEQTLGKPIDHRTDIYSLGICIYEMCLGELPFKAGDLGYHHLHTAPPNPLEKDPEMPEWISKIILRCMEKDPTRRFQSVLEMQQCLPK